VITMKEARRIHRKTMTHVEHVSSGYRDADGNMITVAMRLSRMPFRKWVRKYLVEHTAERLPSPKLARVLRGAS
jgi:hypothetical protein